MKLLSPEQLKAKYINTVMVTPLGNEFTVCNHNEKCKGSLCCTGYKDEFHYRHRPYPIMGLDEIRCVYYAVVEPIEVAYKKNGCYYTDRIYVSNICERSVGLEDIRKDQYLLKYIHPQTEEMCLAALRGRTSLKDCRIKTERVCRLAVKNTPRNIKFISQDLPNDVRNELEIEAVRRLPSCISDIGVKSDELCRLALRGGDIDVVEFGIGHDRMTPELWSYALSRNGLFLRQMKIPATNDMCMTALANCGYALQYISRQTPEMCKLAVKTDKWAIIHVKDPILRAKLYKKHRIFYALTKGIAYARH